MKLTGQWLVRVSLAALLALLPTRPAAPQIAPNCETSKQVAGGTCAGPNGVPGYPRIQDEETGANLYRLDQAHPANYAQNAILEYYNQTGSLPKSLDQKIEAVAMYVDKHMSWRADADNKKVFGANGYACDPGPGADFPQPADLTLKISGTVNAGAPNNDFQGDCEDFAILRAALLRSAKICLPPLAIWDAIDAGVTHEYNIVLYKGAFRIMDYGSIDRWLPKHTWSAHESAYGWNQEKIRRGWSASNNALLKSDTNNCPAVLGKPPSIPWGYLNYYQNKCPCP